MSCLSLGPSPTPTALGGGPCQVCPPVLGTVTAQVHTHLFHRVHEARTPTPKGTISLF